MIYPYLRIDRQPGSLYMTKLGLQPDPWQIDVLDGNHRRLLLNCSRQSGKSTIVALLSLLESMCVPGSLVLIMSRSLRQSTELFRRVLEFHQRLGKHLRVKQTSHELHLTNDRRIISLPCSEPTIRGFANVHMIVIDEAARVPDDLYKAVRPMTAVAKEGRIVCLSTPNGKQGFFYDCWSNGADWTKIEVPAANVSRISPTFLEEERRALGSSFFRQEYCCSFESREGVVYPNFATCVTTHHSPLTTHLRKVGGLDFGFHAPFAALWGILDHDDVLWLIGEHYQSERPLSYHIHKIPHDVDWYADPSAAADIAELNIAGFTVRRGRNPIRLGIAAVSARLENGTLRILPGACPNLLREAELYCYSPDPASRRAETPLDSNNHALDALRYLIASIDERKLRRKPKFTAPAQPEEPKKKPWLRWDNEALWTPIGRCDR